MLMLRALFVSVVAASSASVLRFIDNNTVILLTSHAAYPETKTIKLRQKYRKERVSRPASCFSVQKEEKRRRGGRLGFLSTSE